MLEIIFLFIFLFFKFSKFSFLLSHLATISIKWLSKLTILQEFQFIRNLVIRKIVFKLILHTLHNGFLYWLIIFFIISLRCRIILMLMLMLMLIWVMSLLIKICWKVLLIVIFLFIIKMCKICIWIEVIVSRLLLWFFFFECILLVCGYFFILLPRWIRC
jgi:hypothetical protein